jgi:hypothetical protein
MNKKIVIAIIILISLGIVLSIIYIKYFNFKAISDLKTSFKLSSGQVEAISWDNVTSDDFLNSLNNLQNQGMFSKISPSVLPIEKYRFPNPYFIQNHGFGYIELFLAQIELSTYIDSDKQPYQTVKTYKTNINNENYYLMIQRWINNDKSISFVPIITSDLIVFSDFVENGSSFFPSPIVEIKNIETCIKINGAGVEYCKWYFDNITSYNEIKDKWLSTSIIPTEIAKFPILITKTLLKL